MNLKSFSLLLISLIVFCSSFAQKVKMDDAKILAEKFYTESFIEMYKIPAENFIINKEYIIEDQGEELLFIFDIGKNNGFVIVSANRKSFPVLGYSFKGKYHDNKQVTSFTQLLNVYKSLIKDLSASKTAAHPSITRLWNKYNNSKSPYSKSISTVVPLITSLWDQGCFYNDSCPADNTSPSYYCYRAPVGCIATAMAQIMKYHNHPLQGVSSNSYYDSNYGTLSVDFSNSTYNWNNMPQILGTPNADISKLLYHCGVAVEMDYGPFSSGANLNDAKNGFISYFNYSNSATVVAKSNYSSTDWENLIKSELDSGRPLIYSGVDNVSGGGHAFVCDGYQSNYFHINWGWSGNLNGFFTLTNLNPGGTSNYSQSQEALIGIQPLSNIPNAHFTSDENIIQNGTSIDFSDLSSGTPISWQWSFLGANPSSSNIENPLGISYNNPGKYDVGLIVTNSNGSDTLILNDYIRVTPISAFYASSTFTEVGATIDYYENAEVLSPVTSWLWSFPGANPSSSTQQNPSGISYSSPGKYHVTLTVTNANGSHSETLYYYTTVYEDCDSLFRYNIPEHYINSVDQPSFNIVTEEFDGNIPYYSSLGHISNWMEYNKVISLGDTNFFMGTTSWFNTAGQADDWLEFGPITIPSEGAELQWEHLFWLNYKRNAYELLVSTTGTGHNNFTGLPLYVVSDNDPQTMGDTIWTKQSVLLDSNIYGGQQLYFAFHHFSNDMAYLFIDNLNLLSCIGDFTVIRNDISEESIKLFPNPVNDILIIETEGVFSDKCKIELFNNIGKRILINYNIDSKLIKLDFSGLIGGIYIVKIIDDKGVVSRKIIVGGRK